MADIGGKEVEGDYSDDEIEVVAKNRGGLTSTGSKPSLKVGVEKAVGATKALEETSARGSDVELEFHLPDGRKHRDVFPSGQDVSFVKAKIADAVGIPAAKQVGRRTQCHFNTLGCQ